MTPHVLPIASPAQTTAAVRHLLRGRRALAVGSLGVLAAATAIGLLTPPLLGHIVDLVTDGGTVGALTVPAVLLIAIALTQAVATAIGIGMIARLGEGMLADLREQFVDRALHLPLGRLEQAGSGDLTSRVTNDVTAIAEAVRGALPELARSVLVIGLTLVGLAVLDYRFLLAALLAVPIQWHTVRWYLRRSPALYAAHRVAVGAQQQQLLESIGGAPTVRALRLDERHLAQVTDRSRGAVDLALRAVRLITRFYGRLNLAEFVGLSAVLVVGFLLTDAGVVTIGTTAAATLYFHNLFGPINSALRLVDDAQVATASLARLVGVTQLDTPATPPDHPTAVDTSVKAVDVEYAYLPGQRVLSGVSLDIAPGQRVALVGASGAGKTTLAQLVAGVHRPTAGTIMLGGVELGELPPEQRRRMVAVVTQEVHVFAGPLADDLRLARPDATDEQLRTALAEVEALDWALALPEGLDTVVGDGGHQLSVTQAQQLALARVILADPRVVILDEATADAGSAGARVLERAAERALHGRTALVVAHRLTQAVTADRIVVLEAGRVLDSGTHEELVARESGHYATLWQAWSQQR
ncbi:ABC transporter ATP-binding protein [Micromonospora sp. NBC_01796]|uniref:ABC transporter ATP-binding protein n=1 Tax=Micromonospora sp. NBC_01796 TaxID=2975987 RepID=UPI002DD82A32|nr:ABC transporter ATP-binding protein [Micromonospora sp. NBC_01796]WSA84850.1 ABC transporter ATP-binding protein/permease [Micromonospora sp. NBC_01796]